MKRSTSALATALALVFTPLAAQDYEMARDAYNAGDYATAVREWKLLADQGNSTAQWLLGVMSQNGTGTLQDFAEAHRLYNLSAQQGDAWGANRLGRMYEQGIGVVQDNITAHMWYNLAAANSHPKAGEFRNELAARMTATDISKAQAMARECMSSDYKKCGY